MVIVTKLYAILITMLVLLPLIKTKTYEIGTEKSDTFSSKWFENLQAEFSSEMKLFFIGQLFGIFMTLIVGFFSFLCSRLN